MSTTTTLKKDVKELNGNLALLAGTNPRAKLPFGQKPIPAEESILGALKKDLEQVKTVLGIPANVKKQLSNIDTALSALSQVLTALSLVKQVAKIAERMKKQIVALKSKIKSAINKLNAVVKSLKPYINAIDVVIIGLTNIISAIQEFQLGLIHYSELLIKLEECINSFPKGSLRNSMENSLDEIAEESDQEVVALNKKLEALMSASDQLKAYLKNKISDAVKRVDPIDDAVDHFEDKLEMLLDPLEDLNDLLKTSVTTTFKYSSPSLKNPLRMKTKTLRISMSIVLKGVKGVEKQAKKILSSTLYKALKHFGLDRVIKSLLRKAEGAINKLLKRANLNLPIELEVLDSMDQDLDLLLEDLKGLDLNIDFEAPKIAIDNFDIRGLAFQKSLDSCKDSKRAR